MANTENEATTRKSIKLVDDGNSGINVVCAIGVIGNEKDVDGRLRVFGVNKGTKVIVPNVMLYLKSQIVS